MHAQRWSRRPDYWRIVLHDPVCYPLATAPRLTPPPPFDEHLMDDVLTLPLEPSTIEEITNPIPEV